MQGTTQVVDRLRSEGFQISLAYTAYLLRERIIAVPDKGIGGCLVWTEADERRLRAELLRRGRGPQVVGIGAT